MKKYFVLAVLFFAFGFSRTSTKHQIVVSPEYSLSGKSAFGTVTARDCSEDDSVQWKRRHKRRKKTRRPQRGR